jgi:pimeloyl-ACP methyl ester carboxylesterase
MRPLTRQRFRISGSTEWSFVVSGDAFKPAVLRLHGFPGSAGHFREVVPELSRLAYLIAPDLPGLGLSDVLAGHKRLETHATVAVPLMADFTAQTQRKCEGTRARKWRCLLGADGRTKRSRGHFAPSRVQCTREPFHCFEALRPHAYVRVPF